MIALENSIGAVRQTVTITPGIGFVIEAVLAFFLVTVVLETAVAGRADDLSARAAKAGVAIVEKPLLGTALLDRIRDLFSRGSAAPTA